MLYLALYELDAVTDRTDYEWSFVCSNALRYDVAIHQVSSAPYFNKKYIFNFQRFIDTELDVSHSFIYDLTTLLVPLYVIVAFNKSTSTLQ